MIRYCRKCGMKSYTNISNTQMSQPIREMVLTSIVELKNTSTLQYPPVYLVRRWFCPPFRRQLVVIGISVIIPRAIGCGEWRLHTGASQCHIIVNLYVQWGLGALHNRSIEVPCATGGVRSYQSVLPDVCTFGQKESVKRHRWLLRFEYEVSSSGYRVPHEEVMIEQMLFWVLCNNQRYK